MDGGKGLKKLACFEFVCQTNNKIERDEKLFFYAADSSGSAPRDDREESKTGGASSDLDNAVTLRTSQSEVRVAKPPELR